LGTYLNIVVSTPKLDNGICSFAIHQPASRLWIDPRYAGCSHLVLFASFSTLLLPFFLPP
jgi:hypothetical protein